VSILSREVGGRAVFSCAQGYGLRGPHEAVCQHTGDWASPIPTCQGMIHLINVKCMFTEEQGIDVNLKMINYCINIW
jgi:hypothetical protein